MTTDQLLRVYAQQIRNLRNDEDADINALLVLTTRDALSVAELKDSDRATLAELDEKLIQRQSLLVSVLPFPSLHVREHWWWFLHEGVQVVPQVKQAIAA